LFFAYALGNALTIPLYARASTYLHPAWPDPALVLDVLSDYRPTLFFSVPTVYARLLRAELPADAFRSVRQCVSAGERLPGDIYLRDGDGFYTHCGREDDFFKVAGQWVVPADVEAALMKHPAVLEAGVVGAEEASGLIKPFVFVVPRDSAVEPAGLRSELMRLAEETLPSHERPRDIRIVSELPRTATGKLQRFKLKERV